MVDGTFIMSKNWCKSHIEQHLILSVCSSKFYYCRPNRVFEYVQDELNGVCTENSYPYLATKDQTDCEPMKDKCDKVSHTKVLLHGMLPKSEYALKLGLVRMPISVAINANVVSTFQGILSHRTAH